MATTEYLEYNLPRQAYATFDAVSLRQMFVDKLKDSQLFPDIAYEGSNISALTDILAFSYHLLLFYLNNTSSEAIFSQAELYENINKIVSLIGYKPQGRQTSLLNFKLVANSNLSPNFYTLKRFAQIIFNGNVYSTNKDISFEKTLNGSEEIASIGENNILYQGVFKEYPTYTAIGEAFEQVTIAIDPGNNDTSDKFIDNNNIYVFVKDILTGKWSEWNESSSLFVVDANTKAFEKRFNEFNRYEIKFGNNINGKQLNTGDEVAIFYLQSDGKLGVIGPNVINSGIITLYNSTLFREIGTDIYDSSLIYLNANSVQTLQVSNIFQSTDPTQIESVDEIRQNAPALFVAQNRAVSSADYIAFLSKNFTSIINSCSVINNQEFVSTYIKYFYDIGLEQPNTDERVLFNQVTFNDACDFNNINIFVVPSIAAISNETTPNVLPVAQKQTIKNFFNNIKCETHNITVNDPIYVSFAFGLPFIDEPLTVSIKDTTKLKVKRAANSILSKEQIKTQVGAIITNFFALKNNELGQLMDFNTLNIDILNIPGVSNIEIVRTLNDSTITTEKLNFIYWNPLYPNVNVNTTAQNIRLQKFQFPFFYELTKQLANIIVE
jgi:hypothetical protein